MSTNVKMDSYEIGNKEDVQLNKKQLVCMPSRNCTTPVRSVGKLLNKKEHMDSCLKLLKFVADSELTLTQVNGQRKLGPPSKWTGPPPSPKCEIFVGSIPRNYYEPEIVKIFSSVGQIYELRLMMDFSGTNRGYCFIMYTTEEEAIRAVKELDQFEIYPGKRIGVVASVNNRRLYINQLPETMSTATIIKRFYEVTDDVECVAVYRNFNGFVSYVLISYNTHRGAAMGRRRLIPESLTLFPNCEIIVEWANPNMTPWNVLEEKGVCDKAGNVQIKTVSLMPMRPTKSMVRSKQSKIVDKRSIPANGRAIRAASGNVQNNPDRPSNPSPLEQCQLNNRACPSDLLMELQNGRRLKQNGVEAWDVNGNSGNTLDQSLLYDKLKKNYVQHQQSMILPSISAFLRKRKGPRSFKVNEAQRYSNEDFPSDGRLINNRAPDCSCQCRSREKNSIPGNFDWNTVQDLMSKVSRVLLMPNGNERQILLANNVVGTPNVAASQPPLAYPNHSFANHFQYGNYCPNYPVNALGQIGAAYLPELIPAQCNAYDVRASMLTPSHEHLPQQFLSGNVNSVVLGQNNDWCCSSSMADQFAENQNFPELYNEICYQTSGSQNAQEATYSDKEIGRGSILTSTSNLYDPYACKTPAKSPFFGNDDFFCGNKQSIGEYIQGEEKFAMRPILKVNNPDVGINY
ncbi:uncharacterized protein LOC143361318 [Halictus rubicundus]|uniref:uncharacterized protein LOC143361318 n=1 Tax=Halictus rubicundus TaxID=77578 RepID=UPI0040353A6E